MLSLCKILPKCGRSGLAVRGGEDRWLQIIGVIQDIKNAFLERCPITNKSQPLPCLQKGFSCNSQCSVENTWSCIVYKDSKWGVWKAGCQESSSFGVRQKYQFCSSWVYLLVMVVVFRLLFPQYRPVTTPDEGHGAGCPPGSLLYRKFLYMRGGSNRQWLLPLPRQSWWLLCELLLWHQKVTFCETSTSFTRWIFDCWCVKFLLCVQMCNPLASASSVLR